MGSITFEVPGPPQAQKRHRTFRRGKGVGSYDPSASDKADFLSLAMDYRPKEPLQGPVLLAVIFWMPIPKSTPKYQQKLYRSLEAGLNGVKSSALDVAEVMIGLMRRGNEGGRVAIHTKRPDTDNLTKLVKDALGGVYWKDDSQVQDVAIKMHSHRPRTQIEIRW